MRPVPFIVVEVGSLLRPLIGLKPRHVDIYHRVNGIPSARVTLSDEGDSLQNLTDHQSEIASCGAGESIKLTMHEPGEAEHVLFQGSIVQQTLRMNRDATELVLQLRHDLQKLQNTHRSEVFENMTDAAIAERMLLAQGITALGVTGMTTMHDQLVQFRTSDWNFLRSRINANGVWIFPTPEGVTISEPLLTPESVHTLKQRAGERDILVEEGTWTFSEQSQPSSLTVSSWDDHAQVNETVLAASTRLGSGAFNCATGHELSSSPWSFGSSVSLGLGATTALANGLLMNLQCSRATGDFVIDGSAKFRLGETLSIEGFGNSFDGSSIITGIRHRIAKGGGWRTTLSVGCEDISRDIVPAPRASGMHVGSVSAFKEDPDGMHRFQVRLAVLGEASTAIWARLATPYASAMSGLCLYPEVGDEVVVGFFDEDPNSPIILGSMHNPLNPAPIVPSATNSAKGLVVAMDGLQYRLVFDTQAKRVSLSSPYTELNVADGGTLKTDGALNLSGGKTSLTGSSAVTVKAPDIGFEQA